MSHAAPAPAGPLAPPGERARQAALRQMKLLATGLLVVAAATYAATAGRDGALGFVAAAAEAAMVGALADWFAVTALFRRPLGLPIPHTALIPTRKDALGRSLEEFVSTHFLAEEVVRDKVVRAQVALRAGTWLRAPEHAERVAGELAVGATAAIRVLRDDAMVTVLEQAVVGRVGALSWSPAAGKLLDAVVADRTHDRLVDVLLDECGHWLAGHRETVVRIVTDQAPAWTPRWVDERVGGRAHEELVRWVDQIRADPGHRVRAALDDLLLRLAEDLRHDQATQQRVEQVKQRLMAHPELRTATATVWATARRLLVAAIDQPDGEPRRRAAVALGDLGTRLVRDAALRDRVDAVAADAVGAAMSRYAGELAAVISETVQRWDAAEASHRIELQIGRDLQFIRINGTAVGALAGLAIHTATVLLR